MRKINQLYLKFVMAFILMAGITVSTYSQTAIVSGKVKDRSSQQQLPYSTNVLKSKKDSIMVSGAVTDAEGNFHIDGIYPGRYFLETSFLGYQTTITEVFVGKINQYLDLGTIILDEDRQILGEVVVEGDRATLSNKLDKKSYGVADNLVQSGGSVTDVMRTLPGVTVDQEGQILLRGSDKVTVLIDGKANALTGYGNQKGLDNIPAANIESIEIINNPSAKYNAAGMAGIINIIYKKDHQKGLTGEVGITAGLGALSKRKKDLPTSLGSYSVNPKLTPSLNLNYNTSKLNFFLQSSVLFQEKLPNNEFTIRFYEDQRIIASQVPENRKQTHYIVNGGVDWNLNENNMITFSGIFDYESHVDTSQVPFINQHLDNGRFRFYSWNEEEITGFANINLHYKHQFPQPGHTFNAGFQFTKGWEDESYFLQDSSSVRQAPDTTMLLAEEFTTNLSADYIKPLSSGRIEVGTKFQWRRIPVDYTVGRGQNSIIYPGLGDWSKWGENIYAAYLNYVFEKPDFDIEAGLRAEYTDVFYTIAPENIYYQENDAYHYFELFPNLRLTYNLDENNRVSVFYNRRIDRPGEPELRIFPKYDDPELLKVGNPYLRPQFTRAFELAYQLDWQQGSLYLAGYHRIIKDQFLRIYDEDLTSAGIIINKIYQNTGDATNTGLEVIFSQRLADFWKFSSGFNWYRNRIDPFEGILRFPSERDYQLPSSRDNTWDLKMNHQLEISKNMKIQLTGIYYAPRNIPQGRQFGRSSVDLGIRESVMKGRGEISGSFSDIFNNFGIKQELMGNGFVAVYENFYETQVFRMGFKYKFR